MSIRSKVDPDAIRYSRELRQSRDSGSSEVEIDSDIFDTLELGGSSGGRVPGMRAGDDGLQVNRDTMMGGVVPSSVGGVSRERPFQVGTNPFAARGGVPGMQAGGGGQPVAGGVDWEEEFTKEALKLAGHTKEAVLGLADSFEDFGLGKRIDFGRLAVHYSLVVLVMGLLVGIFVGFALGFNMFTGALLATAFGITVFQIYYDKDIALEEAHIRENPTSPYTGVSYTPVSDATAVTEITDDLDDLFGGGDEEGVGVVGPVNEPYTPTSGTSNIMFTDDFDEDLDEDESDEDLFGMGSKGTFDKLTADSVLDDALDTKMLTRTYLIDTFSRILPSTAPEFSAVRELDINSDEFFAWDSVVISASENFRGNQEDLPTLLKVRERLFYVILEVKRVKWLKNIQAFVDEIVAVYSFDEETSSRDERIHGSAEAVGEKIYVKIYKGATAMVSIKDILLKEQRYFSSTDKLIPVSLGLNAEGNSYNMDLKDMDSLIVSGMPRSGKSWFLLSLFVQMMMFNSPEDLQFYFMDPKGNISDYRDLRTPHVKSFVSSDRGILDQLRNIVKVEGERRAKILGDANEVNIWDFKKKYPDVVMPLLYIVIDEVITLAMRMEDDIKEEFQGLLLELVTRLPALGIRIMMVPHLVKNDILRKSITDVIPCKISVKGDTEHIFAITGDRKFGFPLVNRGDMAVKITGEPRTMFIHGPVIASTNDEIKDIISFIDRFWKKMGYESELDRRSEMRKQKVEHVGGNVKSSMDGYVDLLEGLHDEVSLTGVVEGDFTDVAEAEEVEEDLFGMNFGK